MCKFIRRFAVAAFLLLAFVAQAQTTFTSRLAMGADDTVDWGALGATLPTTTGLILSNPFPSATSAKGLVTVTGLQPLGTFSRLDEGINWHGNFSPGDHLLTTGLTTGPVTITFVSGPVFGAGLQLEMQPIGPFLATLTAFDSTGAIIATVTANATSASPAIADNTASFVGIRTPVAEIAKIEVSCLVQTGRGTVPEVCAMNQLSVATQATPVTLRAYDFNADARADILWRNALTGANVLWFMNSTLITSGTALPSVTDLNWHIVGVGDFNGDGKADILWRHSITGDNAIWFMNGAAISAGALFSTVSDPSWRVAGVGDFNGDGKADILWRNSITGDNAIWLMNGSTIIAGALFSTVADLNWHIVGVGDFNGDGKADILWRNSLTGDNAVWLMNSTSIAGGALLPNVADLTWHIVGVDDFSGDGKADILWRNSATGANAMWLMNGSALAGGASLPAVTDLNWQIAGIRDFNGDGKADILWRNSTTGDNVIWLMNGSSIAASSFFASVADTNWQIVP